MMNKLTCILALYVFSSFSPANGKVAAELHSQGEDPIPSREQHLLGAHNETNLNKDVAQLGFGGFSNSGSTPAWNNLTNTPKILKQITIGIETAAGQGSGVVIGRKGNVYTAITARHVLPELNPNETVEVYSLQTKKYYRVVSSSYPAKDKYDIMLLRFQSNDELPLAVINAFYKSPKGIGQNSTPPWQIIEGFNVESDGIRGGGVSMPSKSVSVPIFRKISAVLLDRARGNKDGYEVLYEASTVPGMSGGPIVGWREACLTQNEGFYSTTPSYFSLIAIHGRSEAYGAGRSGMSLGVPIDLISDYLSKNSSKYGIPIKDSELRALVNKQYC